ncbi:MAG: STAS domain-containing protein [Deltaproteobacteria bacterium]|nr:STAS domain-containing protein [Deltaproteobacteria bacterium]
MQFTSQKISNVTLIRIQGRIDHNTSKDFENALKPHLDECISGMNKKIIVDLNGVDFMTSAGLRALMIAAKTCDKQKAEIAVAALQPIIQEIFTISRFDLVLKIFPTVKSAFENLSVDAVGDYGNNLSS